MNRPMIDPDDSGRDPPDPRRRRFLRWLPTGVAAAAASRADGGPGGDEAGWSEPDPLPMAWWREPGGTARDEPEGARLRDAYRLAAGDPGLREADVMLRVHGIHPSPALWEYSRWRGFQMELVYDRRRDLRQVVWSCENRLAPNIASPLTLRVPLNEPQGLGLTLMLRDEEDRRHRFEVDLTAGRAAGRPRLAPGLYLVALTPGQRIDWRWLRLDLEAWRAGTRCCLHRVGPAGGRTAAGFPCLAFSLALADGVREV